MSKRLTFRARAVQGESVFSHFPVNDKVLENDNVDLKRFQIYPD